MITVIDTSTWVNARVYGGVEEAAVVKAFDLGVVAGCEQLWFELAWILMRKFRFSPELVASDIALYRSSSIETRIDGSITGCADPDDNFILECAVRARAHVIVSNDLKHLVKMRSFECIPIITPEEYLLTPYQIDEDEIASELARCYGFAKEPEEL